MGRQFHSAGPEKEKARSANFVRSLGFDLVCLLNADQIDDSFLLTSSPVQRDMPGIARRESGASAGTV